jgi:hypothetical protein
MDKSDIISLYHAMVAEEPMLLQSSLPETFVSNFFNATKLHKATCERNPVLCGVCIHFDKRLPESDLIAQRLNSMYSDVKQFREYRN